MKSAGVTFLLNFFFPGGGHLYASGGRAGGGILTISIICSILTYYIYVPAFLVLLLWIYTLATSGAITAEHNSELKFERKMEAWEAQRPMREAAKLKQQELERKESLAAENETRKRQEEDRRQQREQAQISGKAVAERLSKIAGLIQAGVFTEDEGVSERDKVYEELANRWTDEDLADFLAPFVELLKDSVITNKDLSALKKLHAAIREE